VDYPYGKIGKLASSLAANGVDPATAAAIMKDGETVAQAAPPARKAAWFRAAMLRLDAALPAELVRKVREDCACCLGGQRHKICLDLARRYPELDERLRAADSAKLVFGHGLRRTAPGVYEVSFFAPDAPAKRCPCLPAAAESLPLSYCYCCGGHVKHHLQTVLGRPLTVRVIETVLSTMGEKGCRFELTEAAVGPSGDARRA
jgi:hypothetical protein